MDNTPAGAGTGAEGSIYEVKQGDCIESIAYASGHFWQTIWNHPCNRRLRNLRKNPNVLHQGDEVFVPVLQPKAETRPTERRHAFVRKGVPSKLQIQLLDENAKPKANVEYVLKVDGRSEHGRSDPNGWVRSSIQPSARGGKLIVPMEAGSLEYPLNLGHLDPIEEVSGIQQRLNNLQFCCGQEDGELGESTKAALKEFQRENGLQETGQPDPPTCEKLKQVFGC